MKRIFAIAFTIMIFITCKAQKENLGLKLEAGKVYMQVSSSKITVSEQVNGQQLDIDMTVQCAVSYGVTKITNDVYDMDVEYKTLSMSIKTPIMSMDYSSEKNDPQDMVSQVLSGMLNSPFQIKMAKNGKITEVSGMESLWENLYGKFPQISESQMAQIKEQLKKSFGPDAFQGNMEMATAIYPDSPVAIGDEWTVHTKLTSTIPGDVISNYKFAGKNPEYIVILGDSKIQAAGGDEYADNNGMLMKYNIAGSMKSEIKVDKSSGWIIDAKITQDIKGDANVKGTPQIPDGIQIPLVMKSEMVITNM